MTEKLTQDETITVLDILIAKSRKGDRNAVALMNYFTGRKLGVLFKIESAEVQNDIR